MKCFVKCCMAEHLILFHQALHTWSIPLFPCTSLYVPLGWLRLKYCSIRTVMYILLIFLLHYLQCAVFILCDRLHLPNKFHMQPHTEHCTSHCIPNVILIASLTNERLNEINHFLTFVLDLDYNLAYFLHTISINNRVCSMLWFCCSLSLGHSVRDVVDDGNVDMIVILMRSMFSMWRVELCQ